MFFYFNHLFSNFTEYVVPVTEFIIPEEYFYEVVNKPKQEIDGMVQMICFFCNKSFNNEINLMEHTLVSHSSKKPFKCVCGHTFETIDKLIKHICIW